MEKKRKNVGWLYVKRVLQTLMKWISFLVRPSPIIILKGKVLVVLMARDGVVEFSFYALKK
jgi:hypothetical protein